MRKAMMERPLASPDLVTIRVPLFIQRRGGRRAMKVPGARLIAGDSPAPHPNSAALQALAKAFRWRKLLETGVYSTVAEIATNEKFNDSYVARIVRLSLLAPELVEALLDPQRPSSLRLDRAMRPFPIEWASQMAALRDRR